MKKGKIFNLLKQGEVVQAFEAADESIDREAASRELTWFAGLLADLKGHPVLAKAILLKSIMVNPDLAETCYVLGNVLSMPEMLVEDSDNALKALYWYDEALKRDPSHLDALHNKALLLLFLGRRGEAEDTFNELLKLEPEHPKYRELGLLISAVVKDA